MPCLLTKGLCRIVSYMSLTEYVSRGPISVEYGTLGLDFVFLWLPKHICHFVQNEYTNEITSRVATYISHVFLI